MKSKKLKISSVLYNIISKMVILYYTITMSTPKKWRYTWRSLAVCGVNPKKSDAEN